MTQEAGNGKAPNTTTQESGTSDGSSTPATAPQDDAPSVTETSASSGPTAGSTGTGIAADETGFGESGSLPDTAAPPVAR